jgi:hypothetical protein
MFEYSTIGIVVIVMNIIKFYQVSSFSKPTDNDFLDHSRFLSGVDLV